MPSTRVYQKHFGGGSTLSAPSKVRVGEEPPGLEILRGINCVLLLPSDGRSGDASF